VFFEKNPGDVLPIASLTKLMTALISTEYINLEKEITITGAMLTYSSVPRLKIGQVYSAYDLLFPLMLESSNEAAQALSYFIGPQRFVDLMNKKAKALGMENTIFADSSGISPVSASNAKDLFALAKYLYFNRNFILKISSDNIQSSIYGSPKFTSLANFNKPKSNNALWQDFAGGKIGLTRASKETIISLFELKIKGEKRPVAVIVLGSDNYFQDVENIVNAVKSLYE
jgi:D-alanyl-D-alanine carboxypeptidase